MSQDAWTQAAEERRDRWRRETDQRILRLTVLMAVHLTLAACLAFGLFWWCADLERRSENQQYINERAVEFQHEVRDALRQLQKGLDAL